MRITAITSLRVARAGLGVSVGLLGIGLFSPASPIYAQSSNLTSIATSQSCLQPPKGVDLSKLPDQTLERYGLPVEIFQRMNPARRQGALQHMKYRSCSSTVNKSNRYTSSLRSGVIRPNYPNMMPNTSNNCQPPYNPGDSCLTNGDHAWVGMSAIQHDYTEAEGYWTLNCGSSLTYYSSDSDAWVGLGQGADQDTLAGNFQSNQALVQAGFQMQFNNNGGYFSTPLSIRPWLEVWWYGQSDQDINTHLIFLDNYFPHGVSCGDYVGVNVVSTPGVAQSNGFLIEDYTTGDYYATNPNDSTQSPEINWPVAGYFSSADWVVENKNQSLFDFDRLTFQGAFAYAQDAVCPPVGSCGNEQNGGVFGAAGDWPHVSWTINNASQQNLATTSLDAGNSSRFDIDWLGAN
ncbi:MAG TPA: hypothetical protein VGS08_01805 [Candidatus Saccharimonadales bacterium]|nr:hypothetical protein [Candidatus Saccharimonadales bacterium]